MHDPSRFAVALALTALALSGCAGHRARARPSLLVDGTRAPALPEVLASLGKGAVMSRVRVLPAQMQQLATCRQHLHVRARGQHSGDARPGPVYFGNPNALADSVPPMNEVTRILSAVERGDPQAAAQLLPLVYQELRKLAGQKLAQEKPGQAAAEVLKRVD